MIAVWLQTYVARVALWHKHTLERSADWLRNRIVKSPVVSTLESSHDATGDRGEISRERSMREKRREAALLRLHCPWIPGLKRARESNKTERKCASPQPVPRDLGRTLRNVRQQRTAITSIRSSTSFRSFVLATRRKKIYICPVSRSVASVTDQKCNGTAVSSRRDD